MKDWLKKAAGDPDFFVGPVLMAVGAAIFLAGLIWAIFSFLTGSLSTNNIVPIILGIAIFFIGTPTMK